MFINKLLCTAPRYKLYCGRGLFHGTHGKLWWVVFTLKLHIIKLCIKKTFKKWATYLHLFNTHFSFVLECLISSDYYRFHSHMHTHSHTRRGRFTFSFTAFRGRRKNTSYSNILITPLLTLNNVYTNFPVIFYLTSRQKQLHDLQLFPLLSGSSSTISCGYL